MGWALDDAVAVVVVVMVRDGLECLRVVGDGFVKGREMDCWWVFEW